MADYQAERTESTRRGQHESIEGLDTNPAETHCSSRQSLLDSDLPPKPSAERGCPSRRRFTLWQSIGLFSFLSLALGTAFTLASSGILIYLWRGADLSHDRKEPEFWTTIVTNGWAARVATICSAVIRTSIAVQVGIVAASLSAIVLETTGARFNDVPILSSERASKSGFINICPAVLRQTTGSPLSILNSFIIILGLTIMAVSTFISTILLSDFTTSKVASPSVTHDRAVASKHPADWRFNYKGPTYWGSKPSSQWRFAEDRIGKPRFGDTGDVYRAMLPFSEAASRTSLEAYDGPALVANVRTICRPPPLQNSSISAHGMISPHFGDAKDSVSAVLNTTGPSECMLYCRDKGRLTGWPVSLCDYSGSFMPQPELSIDSKTGRKHSFQQMLVVNATTNIAADGFRDTNGGPPPERLRNLAYEMSDVWTKAYDANGDHVMSATFCFVNTYPAQIYNVSMTGRHTTIEPSLNTSKVDGAHLQLGNGEDFAKRGILDIDIGPRLNVSSRLVDFVEGVPMEDGPSHDPYYRTLGLEHPSMSKTTWGMMSPAQEVEQGWSANQAHISLFQSIIQKTEDPAVAVQGLITRLYQMVYYNWLEEYDLKYPVSATRAEDRLIPTRWTGLIIVLVLVAVHLGLVFTTIILFVLKTKASALGNTWHTLAQTTQMTDSANGADMMLDDEVKKWAKVTGRDSDVCGIKKSGEDGKVEVQMLRTRS
ncbi:hypothetical protein J7337_011462 [Fusarium musae]|uniref:Uncharacterized protein n=1 Tax=Fusarium musae TaxID=1042133 RepID=A0A9P8D7A4_9HYPO|nr:hypothetical protein J7337_011462 [Fusarium musae]KAG9496682.1 hypothetical protein J7337_011462 [Fusarium musae]